MSKNYNGFYTKHKDIFTAVLRRYRREVRGQIGILKGNWYSRY